MFYLEVFFILIVPPTFLKLNSFRIFNIETLLKHQNSSNMTNAITFLRK